MKKRVAKNIVTTIIGIIVWILVLGLYAASKLGYVAYEFTTTELSLGLGLGYIFFMAKDTLLNGLLLGLNLIKDKTNGN